MLCCPDLKLAIGFYTGILDFTLKYPEAADQEWGVEVVCREAALLLVSRDARPGIAVYIRVDDVDALYQKYISRGLLVPKLPDSPVHNAPVDQTWGMREFYVNDPFGNTLRFASVSN